MLLLRKVIKSNVVNQFKKSGSLHFVPIYMKKLREKITKTFNSSCISNEITKINSNFLKFYLLSESFINGKL